MGAADYRASSRKTGVAARARRASNLLTGRCERPLDLNLRRIILSFDFWRRYLSLPAIFLPPLLAPGILLVALAAPVDVAAPKIGTLDFYGLQKVSEAKVRQVLGAKEGDPLPPSKGDVEERLDELPGVIESHLEAVCCDAGKMILYIGIEEKGAVHFDLREPPEGDAQLPEEIASTYRRFLDESQTAVRRGSTAEDLTRGYSLMADPAARAVQEQFLPLAKDHLAELRNVLRNSSDEDQRVMAVYVIAYAARKIEIVDDLQFALKDADAGVRAGATHALLALAVYARLHPDEKIQISPTWFIEMLNSLSWTDRNNALKALQVLTDKRDASTLDQLRDRALGSLIEMARWKTLPHALPAFVLVGRVAGLSEDQIQTAWTRGDRESVIAAAKKKSR